MSSPTSTNLHLGDAFSEPAQAPRTYRLLRSILRDVFEPKQALVPAAGADLSLGRSEGASISEVLSEVRTKIVTHAVQPRHPWAMAHMVPPPATIAVIADLVIGAMNQCAFIAEEGPIAAPLEQEVLHWLLDRVGFGKEAGGLLTSGGTLSNCIAVYLALERAKQTGSPNRRLCVLASDQAHFSIDKAAALTGLGRAAVFRVSTDQQGRLVPGALLENAYRARNEGRVPFLVICTAGTTNAGTLEPAGEALEVARQFGAWCHLDAAHGGFMTLTTTGRRLTEDWREMDSMSWDPHKSLYASYAVGTLLVRDSSVLTSLGFQSEYALKASTALDAGAYHLEGSRRLEALKLWMCIRHFGINGYNVLSERTLSLAKEFAAMIRSHKDFTLVTEPDTNIVCFRFVDPGLNERSTDRINEAIQASLFERGGPLVSSTKVGGLVALRAVLLNPRLTVTDLETALDLISQEGRRGLGARPPSTSLRQLAGPPRTTRAVAQVQVRR